MNCEGIETGLACRWRSCQCGKENQSTGWDAGLDVFDEIPQPARFSMEKKHFWFRRRGALKVGLKVFVGRQQAIAFLLFRLFLAQLLGGSGSSSRDTVAAL